VRPFRSVASATLAAGLGLVLLLPYDASAYGLPGYGVRAYGAWRQAPVRTGESTADASPVAGPAAAEPFGATCRSTVSGSEVTAYCHNPYPETDRVALHIECARWWDVDSDGVPVDARPAQTVRLTGRCWEEIGSVWISHLRAD
jgi:hypothetical protein